MDWINKHLVELLLALGGIGGVAAVGRKGIKGVWAGWRLYRRATVEVHETQERLAEGYQGLTTLTERERDNARAECRELRKDLYAAVRAKDLRDAITRQDRAEIRLLKARMREHRLDYSDIEETVQTQFSNE
jgi:multidrug resistance efflux pump